MNTCGTCKYRGEPAKECYNFYDDSTMDSPHHYRNLAETYFLCTRIKHVVKHSAPHGNEQAYPITGDGAYVEDGSGYYAALCVESDFGCNKWEAA